MSSAALAERPVGAEDLPRRAFVAQIMGLPMSIHVRGPLAREAAVEWAVDAAFDELRADDAMFSTWQRDSPVSRIRDGRDSLVDAHPRIRRVAALCELAGQRTGGAFSAWLPDPYRTVRFDPTGLVKGWAVERVAAAFDDELASDAARPDGEGPGSARRDPALDLDRYVGLGGDLDLRVARPEQPAWRVGVADPARPGEVLATLGVRDGAVATSGTAERGTHLWDPRTGGAADAGLASVTVVGRSLAWADAIATALFVAGEAAVPRWTRRGYRVLTVRADGTLTRW